MLSPNPCMRKPLIPETEAFVHRVERASCEDRFGMLLCVHGGKSRVVDSTAGVTRRITTTQFAFNMKSTSLNDLILYLDQRNEADFKGDLIGAYLKATHIPQDDFAPYIFFREETYGRNLVSGNDLYQLLVLTWLPKQKTPIHDHAGQRCWMTVISGKLAVQSYKPLKPNSHDLIPCGPVETRTAGETSYIDDDIGIHELSNPFSKPAVSVHLFSAPVHECRIYNDESKRFQWSQLGSLTDPKSLIE